MPVLRTHARWSRKQGSGATHVGVQACWFIRIYGLIYHNCMLQLIIALAQENVKSLTRQT